MPSPDRHFANAAIFTQSTGITPNSGDAALYIKSDNRAYIKNSAGTEIIVGTDGTLGTIDNVVPRADGIGGTTLQNSGLIVEDTIVSITGITGDALTDVITATSSAFANGQPVRFTALTGGTGLNTTTNYFVRDVSGDTFKLETSISGGAINFTTNITAGTLLTGHSVSVNVTLSENTTATNSDLVLSPKGTGALILGPKPDGTATGGNARGAYAVDLQTSKASATAIASGPQSAILGGTNSVASGSRSAVICGNYSQATGSPSLSICDGSQASASSSLACGYSAKADRYGMQAYTSGSWTASSGDFGGAQRARFVMRNKTTTNAAVELFLDGSTTRLTIPSGKYLTGTINIAGIKSDGATAARYIRQFSIKNVALTTSLVGTVDTVGTDIASGTVISITADDPNDALKVEVTGIAAETWRWVASVDVVEIAYGT